MTHPDALPGHEFAVIPDDKISGYALNPLHDVGQHKARVFAAMLGINRNNADILMAAIRAGIRAMPADRMHADHHGQRYKVDLPVTGPGGSAMVRTAWIVRVGGFVPHLTSVYVKERRDET